MKAQHAPGHGPTAQCPAQLVAEAHRRQDLAIPKAALGLAIGRLVETLDWLISTGERNELVDVILHEFVSEEDGGGVLGDLLDQRSGEQERRRIDGREKDRVDRDHLTKAAQRL